MMRFIKNQKKPSSGFSCFQRCCRCSAASLWKRSVPSRSGRGKRPDVMVCRLPLWNPLFSFLFNFLSLLPRLAPALCSQVINIVWCARRPLIPENKQGIFHNPSFSIKTQWGERKGLQRGKLLGSPFKLSVIPFLPAWQIYGRCCMLSGKAGVCIHRWQLLQVLALLFFLTVN